MDRWIYFIKYAEKFTENTLPVPLKEVNTIEKANRIVTTISLNQSQRSIYENRLKMLRDEDAIMQTAKRKAKEEGREEGREEGIKEGKLESARKMLQAGIDRKEIARILEIEESSF